MHVVLIVAKFINIVYHLCQVVYLAFLGILTSQSGRNNKHNHHLVSVYLVGPLH